MKSNTFSAKQKQYVGADNVSMIYRTTSTVNGIAKLRKAKERLAETERKKENVSHLSNAQNFLG